VQKITQKRLLYFAGVASSSRFSSRFSSMTFSVLCLSDIIIMSDILFYCLFSKRMETQKQAISACGLAISKYCMYPLQFIVNMFDSSSCHILEPVSATQNQT
jgi:hypothetical protein